MLTPETHTGPLPPLPLPAADDGGRQARLWLAVCQGLLIIVGAIEREYKPERAAQRAAFDRWVKEQGR